MKPIIARTEKGWQDYQREHAELFSKLRELFPVMQESIMDFAKAAFIAGANYEYAYLTALDDVLKARGAAYQDKWEAA